MNTTKFHHKSNSTRLNILLHGASKGIGSEFMTKLFRSSDKLDVSTIAFNFSYIDEGKEFDKSQTILEECVDDLIRIMKIVDTFGFEEINFVGKSLGAIVASEFLLHNAVSQKVSLVCLGYTKGHIKLPKIEEEIKIIQGEFDRFATSEEVKEDVGDTKVKIIEIKGADHSYKDPETKEPKYVDEAIAECFGL